MADVVYFELNNWSRGSDYPNAEPFLSWFAVDWAIPFRSDEWCKANRLCVVAKRVDMSQNFCITATKEWVQRYCPELLTKYREFVWEPDENGCVEGNFSYFLDYTPENFGVHYDLSDEDEDDKDDEENDE